MINYYDRSNITLSAPVRPHQHHAYSLSLNVITSRLGKTLRAPRRTHSHSRSVALDGEMKDCATNIVERDVPVKGKGYQLEPWRSVPQASRADNGAAALQSAVVNVISHNGTGSEVLLAPQGKIPEGKINTNGATAGRGRHVWVWVWVLAEWWAGWAGIGTCLQEWYFFIISKYNAPKCSRLILYLISVYASHDTFNINVVLK
ncbi:hypothetical protein B0H13DRAFT_1887287 [Mycena leptocephala]|nr:hypothetical protein B0H13DRAFT_1887287 [Mycena leptocephala]